MHNIFIGIWGGGCLESPSNPPTLTADCSIWAISMEAIEQFEHKVFFIEVNTWLEYSKLYFLG